jgi:general secretion pathway protein F
MTTLFRYEAVTPAGELSTGEMEAADQAAVVLRLQEAGLIPLRAEPSRFEWRVRPAGARRVARRELALFIRELASLVHAGLTVDRALQVIIDATRDAPARALAGEVQQAVRAGASLSDALEAQRPAFSRFHVSMVRAAEAGGALDQGLAHLAEHEERARALRESVVSALVYPAILVAVAGAALLLLLAYVVPQFVPLFADAGRALPLSTRVVMGAAELLRELGPAAALAGVALALAARRYRYDGLLLRLPLAGELVRRMEMARLSRSLATLLAGGVPLLAALSIARDLLANRVLSESLEVALAALKGGGSLSGGLASTGLFPALGVQMIKVGEESGRLEEMLGRVADLYDGEVAAATRRLLSVLEPALIVGLGALIGAVILSVLAAIVGINELPL